MRSDEALQYTAYSMLICLVFPVGGAEAAKILFLMPMATHSETHFFLPIAKELVNRGHQVTLVTNRKGSLPHPNVTDIVPLSTHDVFGPWGQASLGGTQFWQLLFQDYNGLVPFWDKILENKEYLALQHQKFDLVFLNTAWDGESFGMVHRIGAPYIAMHALPLDNVRGSGFGYYMPPSHVPHPLIGFTDNMNFFQRLMSLVTDWVATIHAKFYFFGVIEHTYRKHLGQDVPSVKEIQRKQQSLLIVNSHHLTNFHRPIMPDVIEAGCLHCHPAKPLPEDLEKIMNKEAAPEGFIYFSFGTIVDPSTMTDELKQKFVNVFSRLKQKVIWKYDGEPLANLSRNVVTKKWLPQQDILGHPNIRLFITHGGLLSCQQTMYHGIPVVVFPFWYDQPTDAQMMVEKGLGEKLDLWNFTEEQLETAIKKIINEPKYKRQAEVLSEVFKDQLNSPLEKVMHGVEHVLKFKGAPHLRSSSRDLNVIQQQSVDVIAFLVLLVLFAICSASQVIVVVLSRWFGSMSGTVRVSKKTN